MGIAMVVAVFVMTLAIAQGFRGALVASGSNENAILLRKGATSETVSARAAAAAAARSRALPQVARGADGHPLALARARRHHLAAARVRQPAGQRAAARRRAARASRSATR